MIGKNRVSPVKNTEITQHI